MRRKSVIKSGEQQKTEEKNGTARRIFKAEIEHGGINDELFRT